MVKEKLAACVNIIPIKSIFSWEEKIEKADEFILNIKTKENLVDELVERLKEIHPYELPVIEIDKTETTQEAEDWVNKVTK